LPAKNDNAVNLKTALSFFAGKPRSYNRIPRLLRNLSKVFIKTPPI